MATKRGQRGGSPEIELNLVPIMGLLVVLIPLLLYTFKFFEIKVQAVSAPRMSTGKAKKKPTKDKKPLNLTIFVRGDRFEIAVQEEHMMALKNRYPDWDHVILKKKFQVGGKHKAQVRDQKGKIIEQDQMSGWYGDQVKKVTEYDFPTLYTRLMQVKKAYPKEKTVNIGANMTVRWQTLARTIDAARVELMKPRYQSLEAYSMALSKQRPRTCNDKKKCDEGSKCVTGTCQRQVEGGGAKPVLEDVPLFPGVVFVVAEN